MENNKNEKPGQGEHEQAKKTFPAATLDEVAGMLQGRVTPKSDEEIEQAMKRAGMGLREEKAQK